MSDKPHQHVTLQDVARACGVHRTTVALVIRGDNRISGPTREKVMEAVERLGYRPDPVLSALSRYRRARRPAAFQSVLAIMTNMQDWKEHYTGRQFFEGIETRAKELGYIPEEYIAADEVGARTFLRVCKAKNVHGVILARMRPDRPPVSIPPDIVAIGVGRSHQGKVVDRVSSDHFQGIRLAVREMHRLGYRRITLVIAEEWDERADFTWVAGFRDSALRLGDVKADVLMCPEVEFKEEKILTWAAGLKTEAIVSPDLRVAKWLRKNGLRVPEDIGFAGLDVPSVDAPYAGIFQHSRDIGARAVDLVDSMLHRPRQLVDRIPMEVTLKASWVDGPTLQRVPLPNK